MDTTGTKLLVAALTEIKVARAGDSLPPNDADLALERLNGLLDAWNANGRALFDTQFYDFTLIPNHNPHTIGAAGLVPAADFVVPVGRPVELLDAKLNLGGSPAVFVPLKVRSDKWYAGLTVPGLPMAVVTDVSYSAAWPLGQLYFYGTPSTAYGVRLWMRVLFANITDPSAALSLPLGYYRALYLSLAEDCARAFGQEAGPELKADASAARALVFGNNDDDMSLDTADAGLQQGGGAAFNWLSRESA